MSDYQNERGFPKWQLSDTTITVFNNQNGRYLKTSPKWMLFIENKKTVILA